MPRHDVYCPGCGFSADNIYLPLQQLAEPIKRHGYTVTQEVTFPGCPQCASNGGYVQMTFRPPRVVMDAYEPFREFTTEVRQPDGSYAPVLIDSLKKLRAVEADSAQRAKNGEGQQMVWRDYAQDRSNGDVNTLGSMTGPKLDEKAKQRFGGSLKRQVDAPDASYGPGVSDANTSALSTLGAGSA